MHQVSQKGQGTQKSLVGQAFNLSKSTMQLPKKLLFTD